MTTSRTGVPKILVVIVFLVTVAVLTADNTRTSRKSEKPFGGQLAMTGLFRKSWGRKTNSKKENVKETRPLLSTIPLNLGNIQIEDHKTNLFCEDNSNIGDVNKPNQAETSEGVHQQPFYPRKSIHILLNTILKKHQNATKERDGDKKTTEEQAAAFRSFMGLRGKRSWH